MTGGLAYPVTEFFRPRVRIEEVLRWAESRTVPVMPFNTSDASKFNWDEVCAFWMPMDLFHEFRAEIPTHVRVIADYDSPKQDDTLRKILGARPIGIFRAFSCFRPRGLNIEMESFYWHLPVSVALDSRSDIIFIDTNRHHPAVRHAQALNALCFLDENYRAISSLTGEEIKLYLTGFNPLAAYQEAVAALGRHFPSCKPLANIEANLIPPAKERADYERLIARCRLFITDQPDLADIGLFEMVMNRVPVTIMPLSSLFYDTGKLCYSMKGIASDIAPGFKAFLEGVNSVLLRKDVKDLGALLTPAKASVPVGFAADLFHQSWDDMWDWVMRGEVQPPYQKFRCLNEIREIDTVEDCRREFGRFSPFICFFGGSGRFLKVITALGNNLDAIACVFDNAESKWGKVLSGIPVRSPMDIVNVNPGAIFVTTAAAADVVRQLLDYKIEHGLGYEILIVNDPDAP